MRFLTTLQIQPQELRNLPCRHPWPINKSWTPLGLNPEKTLTLKELSNYLSVPPDARAFLRKRIRHLVHSGHLRALPLKRFALAHTDEQLEGTVRRNPRGFGWFIADDPEVEDAFIPPPAMSGLFDGDRISAVVYQSPKGWDTQVHQVLERGRKRITGTYLPREVKPTYSQIPRCSTSRFC